MKTTKLDSFYGSKGNTLTPEGVASDTHRRLHFLFAFFLFHETESTIMSKGTFPQLIHVVTCDAFLWFHSPSYTFQCFCRTHCVSSTCQVLISIYRPLQTKHCDKCAASRSSSHSRCRSTARQTHHRSPLSGAGFVSVAFQNDLSAPFLSFVQKSASLSAYLRLGTSHSHRRAPPCWCLSPARS